MNSDYNNIDFILRMMKLKYSMDYDMDLFKNCVVKFYIFISSDDELAESMMLADAIRIISDAQALGAKLVEDYEKYEKKDKEDVEEEESSEDDFIDEDDSEVEDFSGEDEVYDESDEENVMYLEQKEFDLITEGLCDEIWEEENERYVFFVF